MTTPTPERPTMADDLDQAYAQAHALADGDRGPAASVRANVLAAAREIAAQAAAMPPLAPVAAPVSEVGRGRAGAWNLSSWRVRSGAAICGVLLLGLAAVRFDASRHGGGNVLVAAAGGPLPVQVVPPAPAADLPPRKRVAVPGVVAQEHVAAATVEFAPVALARAKASEAKAAPRATERVVAQADKPAAAFAEAPNARAERSTLIAGLQPPAFAYAPAPVERRATAVGPPAPIADTLQRVEVTGSSISLSSAPTSQALRGSAEIAGSVSPAPLGSALRTQPTPLHVAANADDVDTLETLLADPATRVDATDTNGRTPLMYAVMAANVRAVRMLLAAGADPDRADSTGATPRSVARTGPDAEISALLAVRR